MVSARYCTNTLRLVAVLVAIAALALMSRPAHAADQLVENNAGDDTAAIQAAVDAATGGTSTTPARVELRPQSSVDCYTVSQRSNVHNAVEFDANDQHILVDSTVDGSPYCIQRASVPTGGSGNEATAVHYFDVISNGAADIRFDDFYIDGRDPSGGHVDDITSKDADIAFVSQPGGVGDVVGEGDNFALKIDGFTLTDGTIDNLYGTCVHIAYTKNINMARVDCVDPVRGGFEFAMGAWGGSSFSTRGTLTDLNANLTGDDAIAFNSCFRSKPQTKCGFAGGFNINGTWSGNSSSTSRFGVDPADRQGNSFMARSAHDVTADGVIFSRAGIGVGNPLVNNPLGNKDGAAQFEDACYDNSNPADKVCDGDFGANADILLEGGELEGGATTNGAYFDDVTNQSNIVIRDNRIEYNNTTTQYGGPFCGVKISAATHAGGIGFGVNAGLANTFVPNSGRNICDNR